MSASWQPLDPLIVNDLPQRDTQLILSLACFTTTTSGSSNALTHLVPPVIYLMFPDGRSTNGAQPASSMGKLPSSVGTQGVTPLMMKITHPRGMSELEVLGVAAIESVEF